MRSIHLSFQLEAQRNVKLIWEGLSTKLPLILEEVVEDMIKHLVQLFQRIVWMNSLSN